jgi:hypothetical protein
LWSEKMSFLNIRHLLATMGVVICLSAAGESACATVDVASATVRNDSGTTKTNVPVSFGQVFAQGEVIDPSILGARLSDGTQIPLQVDAKATHSDGSLRHAVVTVVLPSVAGNSSSAITLIAPGQGAVGNPVSLDDLLATSFDSQISVNVGGTVYTASARTLLQNNTTKSWLTGPLVSEWLVSGPLTASGGAAHEHLTARFHIRAFEGIESVRVSVTLENNWVFQSGPQNFDYDATVTVEGRGTVLSQDNVSHYRQARWRRVFWWGNDPQLDVEHDSSYMQKIGVVPTYDSRLRIPESALQAMEWTGNATRLMASGLIYNYMPEGGGRPDIAPLPRWTARYLMTQDRRAKMSMLGTGEQAGSFGVHYRDKTTDLPMSLDTFPNATIMGSTSIFPSCGGNCSTPYTPDVSHQPSLSYVPYLVTGDYFHLEELQFWANWNLFYWGDHGGSQGLMVNDQIRAQAWGMRTLGHAAYITPDDHPLKAYFLAKLSNNLSWYERNVTSRPPTPLGYLLNPPNLGLDNTFATWMDDFFTWTVGHLANLGFVEAQGIFDYKAKFPVGRMTDPDSCWIIASTYWTRGRDETSGEPYTNWAAYKAGVVRSWDSPSVGPSFSAWDVPPNMSSAQENALINAVCNSTEMASILGMQRGNMIGGSWSHEGYPANLQPAVAIVAERGVLNGDQAWSLFDGRAVVPDSGNYDYNVSPQWAIVPGNVDLGNPTPPRPTVSISANPTSVASGNATTLSWSTSSADSCVASGAWSGSQNTSGSVSSGALTNDSTFTLECSNAQGSASASVDVRIAAASAPVVSLSASSNSVSMSSNVTLTWSAGNAESCSASGDWSGSKSTSGTETVGPITVNSSFTLRCTAAGVNGSKTVAVSVSAGSGGETPEEESGGGAIGYLSLLAYLLLVRSRLASGSMHRMRRS